MENNTMLPGMLGLEMPLHQQPPPPHHLQQPHHVPPFASFLNHDSNSDHHSHQQPPPKHPSYGVSMVTKPTVAAPKQQLASFTDEEDTASGYAAVDGGATGDRHGGKRVSPWQRMKWTDDMVRLLIMVVFFVGDDACESGPGGEKKKLPGAVGASGLLQKKGKWKSVSRTMLEKGYYVSPQQCEDKFNDLNKRYKRVNDILGKGTACKVVENQSLLETMDHISPKMKEEVRKLLNSKHLFFREMCAYHTSCAGGHQICEVEPSPLQQQQNSHNQQQSYLRRPHGQLSFREGIGNEKAADDNQNDGDNGVNDDEEDDDVGDGDDYQVGEDDTDKGTLAKRLRRNGSGGFDSAVSCLSPLQQQLQSELASVLQDGGKSMWEQRQWIKNRSVMLEDQKVRYQCQAFELEKQRFKWQKFSRKKERELERMKLDNERMRHENERMLLVLRQKEMEINSVIRRSEPSSVTG